MRIHPSQIKKRDFMMDKFKGDPRESFAFVKFIINSLAEKALSATIQKETLLETEHPQWLWKSKLDFDASAALAVIQHNRSLAMAARYDENVEIIKADSTITEPTRLQQIIDLGMRPTPVWKLPAECDRWTSAMAHKFDTIEKNRKRANDDAAIALGHIRAHLSDDTILHCVGIFENQTALPREKLLSLFDWIRSRCLGDSKVIQRVLDDMKNLQTVNDWHEAVANILAMNVLQEESESMNQPMSDTDLITTHISYLNEEICFQHIKVKYASGDAEVFDTAPPTITVSSRSGSSTSTMSTVPTKTTFKWSAYCAEIRRYQGSLKEAQPQSVLSAQKELRSPDKVALAASTNESTDIRQVIVESIREAMTGFQASPPRPVQSHGTGGRWGSGRQPFRGSPTGYAPRSHGGSPNPLFQGRPPYSQNFSGRGAQPYTQGQGGRDPRQFGGRDARQHGGGREQRPFIGGRGQFTQSDLSGPPYPQRNNKRGLAAMQEQSIPWEGSQQQWEYQQQQEYFAGASMVQWPPPMDHSWYDEAGASQAQAFHAQAYHAQGYPAQIDQDQSYDQQHSSDEHQES